MATYSCNWTHAAAPTCKNSQISSMEFEVMSLEISTRLVKIISTDEEQFRVVGKETGSGLHRDQLW